MTSEPVTSRHVLEAALTPSDSLAVTDSGELAIEGCEARAVLARFGSPLFVLSDRTLRRNVRRIREAFEAEWPGPLNVMYAIKCNPDFAVRAVVTRKARAATASAWASSKRRSPAVRTPTPSR